MSATTTLATPDGPFTLITDDDAVLASGWTAEPESLRTLIHPSLRPAGLVTVSDDDPTVAVAVTAVRRYYAGDTAALHSVSVRQTSGPFRQTAWEVLRGIEAGAPVTYAEYAQRCGNPTAVRAAAGACAHNAAALFVPCHRVLRSDGSLGGFRYGLTIKESLLRHEAALSG